MNKHLVFMSANSSLVSWKSSGALSREISIFRKIDDKPSPFALCTYGSLKDREIASSNFLNIITLGYRINLLHKIPFLSSIIYLIRLFSNDLSSFSSFISLQTSGAWLPLVASILKNKRFVYRYGFDACLFIRKSSGYSFIYFYFLIIHIVCVLFSNAIVVTSALDKSRLVTLFPFADHKIKVLSNFVDTSLFLPFNGVSHFNRLYPIYVGRLARQKCIPDLVNISSLLQLPLTVIGSGSAAEVASLKSIASRHNVPLNYIRSVANSDLPAFYHTHNLFLLMSEYEGNPKSLLEAMSAGLICIVKKSSYYDQPIVDKVNGFLISSPFVHDEITSLISSLSNINLLKSISNNARSTIVNNNSLTSYIRDLSAISNHE